MEILMAHFETEIQTYLFMKVIHEPWSPFELT